MTFRNYEFNNNLTPKTIKPIGAKSLEELSEKYGITLEGIQAQMNNLFPGLGLSVSSKSIEKILENIKPTGRMGEVALDPMFNPYGDNMKNLYNLFALQKLLPEKLVESRFFPNRYATGGFVMPTPEQPPAQYAMGGMVHAAKGGRIINGNFFGKFSDGGMVPSYLAQGGYANGGFAMGTDTVPAMLTPGEFVIKKSAVDRIGVSTLSKINGYADGGLVAGTSTDSSNSVYNNNYEINVNVRSDANPDQIARAVMTQIKQIDNANIRGINR
jgi:hypothetical protein